MAYHPTLGWRAIAKNKKKNLEQASQSRLDSVERIYGQSRPDSGLGFQVRVLESLEGVPSSLGSGSPRRKLWWTFHVCWHSVFSPLQYRGASLIRNRRPLGSHSRTMPMALWGSLGGGAVSH